MLDRDGRILDGRNRLAACEMVGVEPTFETYEGKDADAYALSVNIARRFLSKGQQAMIAARACSVSEQTKRRMAELTGLSLTRIGEASTVLAHAGDLAGAVTAGAIGLDGAYEIARKRKADADSDESQLATLQAEAVRALDELRPAQCLSHHGRAARAARRSSSSSASSSSGIGMARMPPRVRVATYSVCTSWRRRSP